MDEAGLENNKGAVGWASPFGDADMAVAFVGLAFEVDAYMVSDIVSSALRDSCIELLPVSCKDPR